MVEREREDKLKQVSKLKPVETSPQEPKRINLTPNVPPPAAAEDSEKELFLSDLESSSTDGTDINPFGSGSALLDLTIPADDTSLGGILDQIYVPEGAPSPAPRQLSPEAIQARASLEQKLFTHDDVMARIRGFKKITDYRYTNGTMDVLFCKDKKGTPRIFFSYGYSLRKIIPPGSEMNKLKGDRKTTYKYFDFLAATYFKGNGVFGEGVIPSNKYSRVVFGFSVAYDPDDADKLEATIQAYVKCAQEKDTKMKQQIEKELGKGTEIRRISGQAAFDLYRLGFYKYQHLKNIGIITEAAGLEEPRKWTDMSNLVEQAQGPHTGPKKESAVSGKLPWYQRTKTHIHNFLLHHS